MWSAPAKNMKKINMSISFVYDVSIQDNCENAVFTFLPFYIQNQQHNNGKLKIKKCNILFIKG